MSAQGQGGALTRLPRGPIMIGVEGIGLSEDDRRRLVHPHVGGVILFARNFESSRQLKSLTAEIRGLRTPLLLIAVDHEGGRVQRFRTGFTAIPPMRSLGELWDRDIAGAAHEAARIGRTIAEELVAHGVDFSFTPVLDLDHGASTVIGDRALHRNPNAVAHLAAALHAGLRAGGMAAVGKHFPGHGHVAADSHTDLPIDDRPLAAIAAEDLVPFGAMVQHGLEAIMPAHVVYSGGRLRRRRVIRASGCRRSFADGSASTASSFPTTSAWPVRKVQATLSPGRRHRSRRVATWSWPAMTSWPRITCSRTSVPCPAVTSRAAPRPWHRGSVRMGPAAAEPSRELLRGVRHDGSELAYPLVRQP